MADIKGPIKEKEAEKNVINLGSLQITEEVTLRTDEIRESVIVYNDEKFFTEIVYDEGRDKYRAAITKNSQKTNLSFFNSKKIAYKALLINVAALIGVRIKDTNINMLGGI